MFNRPLLRGPGPGPVNNANANGRPLFPIQNNNVNAALVHRVGPDFKPLTGKQRTAGVYVDVFFG